MICKSSSRDGLMRNEKPAIDSGLNMWVVLEYFEHWFCEEDVLSILYVNELEFGQFCLCMPL
jgi:hypothetical protein